MKMNESVICENCATDSGYERNTSLCIGVLTKAIDKGQSNLQHLSLQTSYDVQGNGMEERNNWYTWQIKRVAGHGPACIQKKCCSPWAVAKTTATLLLG